MAIMLFEKIVQEYKEPIEKISENGPKTTDYQTLADFFKEVQAGRRSGSISDEQHLETRNWFNGAMSSTSTLQGHVCLKPRGYDGDFEIIDKIYSYHRSSNEREAAWDDFFHFGDASKAVRNRKDFFKSVLATMPRHSKILNLACGPSRDLLEFMQSNDFELSIDNVDLDENAIAYSKLMLPPSGNIQFHHKNVLRFSPEQKYDLIWSAGLFDYFDDKVFTRLINRYVHFLNPGGRLIVGNFSLENSSRDYMEYGNWNLYHRSREKLVELSIETGLASTVHAEPLAVNLFLELTKN